MTERFAGRSVLVTGGGSGIGRATALRLAADGAAVAAVDLSEENADATATAVRESGGRALAIGADVSVDAEVAGAVERTDAELDGLHGVVTCAGIFHGGDGPAADVTWADFMHVIGVNLGGTFSAIKHALPHLVENGGAIVTIASVAALVGNGRGSGYTASKGGVTALTRLLAVQYGPQGVRANCICPGGVDTPMTAGFFTSPEAIEVTKRRVPLQTVAQPEQIAAVVAFLLSDDADHVTGQTIAVDGGTTITG